ncbi:MAG: iron ABC transporter permease [Opitutales bacterium]|nr:iron ABC transporter permease [Opitutales bacterium]
MLHTRKGRRLGLLGLVLLLLAVSLAGCVIGSASVSVADVLRVIASRVGLYDGANSTADTIIWSLRMPRVVLAALAGASLSMSGAAMQGMFRNALADPALIGVSGGGALGAVGAAVLGGSLAVMPPAAIVGALATTALVYRLAKVGHRVQSQTMLLAGLAVNALSGALVGFLIQIAPYEQIRGVLFWLLGSLSGATWRVCGIAALFVTVPLLLLPRHSRALNAMLLGDAEAFHLGYDVRRVKRSCVTLSACMVGASVAFCGAIGFVGLVVPHVVRMLFGPDHRILLPASALGGALLMVLADIAARTLDAPAELPVGVLTALMGAPFFLYLIQTRKSGLNLK